VGVVARVLALIGTTLLLVAGIEVYNGLNLHATREGELRGEAMQLAGIAALEMKTILEGARQLLATLAKLPTAGRWDAHACSLVEATVNSDFEYDFISAVDSDGRLLCSTDRPTGELVFNREVLDRVLASHNFVVGSYGRGKVSGNEVIRIGYPIVDDTGTVTGAIYAGLNATWLNTEIDQWQLLNNVTVAIADRNGRLIARHPGSQWVGHEIADDLLPALRARQVGTTEALSLDGKMRLSGYVPPHVAPYGGLFIVVGLDYDSEIAKIDHPIMLNLAVILGCLLISAAIASFYARYFIKRPLQRLLSAAAHWQDGDWTIRTKIESGNGEFSRLGVAFDAMASAIAARERQRDEFEFQLHQAQKMEALGTLAGGIAHDLNNALTPVISLSKLLARNAAEGSRERQNLGLIEESGKRARDLVHRIVTFARHDKPQREQIDLGAVTADTLKLLRASLPATLAIEARIAPVPQIWADTGQLNQVLMNLVTNAAQAIGDRVGTITVEVAEVVNAAQWDGAAVQLTIADTGCGMDDATRRRIFDPFFTTKAVGEGTGLGLSIVHGIVKSHGGSISVQSEPGRGSQFKIFLPIAGAATIPVPEAAA
jgi:signal transduction histidine kinase